MAQDVADLLQCSICMSQFKDPKFLTCHHTFCSSCLEPILKKWSAKKSFPCPLCRKMTAIPEEGSRGFQENFYISKLLNKSDGAVLQTCDACTKGNRPIYKCIVCELLLCETCKEAHNRKKLYRDHAMVAIKPKKELTNCEIHQGNMVQHFCTFCKQKLCTQCRDELHNGHDIEYLTVAAERERLNIREVSGNVRTYLESFDKTIKEVKLEYKRMNKDILSVRQAAHEHGEKIKQGIDESLAAFDIYLGLQKKSCKNQLVEFANIVQGKQKQTSDILKMLEEKMTKDSDAEILDGSRHLLSHLLDIARKRSELPRNEYHFFPREIPFDGRRTIGEMIGNEMPIIAVTLPKQILYTPMFEIKLVSTFDSLTGERRVTSIAPISSNYAWVCYNKSSAIYLCSKNGELKKQITLPGRVENIAVKRDGSLTVASYQSNILWKVDKTYTGIVREDNFDYHPRELCWTSNGLYGIFMKTISFISNKKKSKISRFDSNMKLIQELENRDETNNMFQCNIAENCDGDLLTVGQNENHTSGCDIFKLSPSFQIKDRRRCQTSAEDSLKPDNICSDAYGNIFLTVSERKVVYLLKSHDSHFKEFLTDSHGISRPHSIAIDGDGHLWIGDAENGHVHIFKYMK